MYAYINGAVDSVFSDRAIVEAAGVGYELLCSANTLKKIAAGTTAKLYTHLYLAEGIMCLYGFYDTAEREMFRRLIGITRVGPKLALAVLSLLTPSDVAAAVLTQNVSAFSRVPGMGKKTAERVLLEMKEKVDTSEMGGSTGAVKDASGNDIRTEAVAALVSLGYDGLAASRAVTSVGAADSVEQLIMMSLRQLAKN